MGKKTIYKTVSLNDAIIKAITIYQAENQCADFSEALRLIVTSHFKNIDDQKEEKKIGENIELIKDSIKVIANYLKAQNDKK